MTLKIVLTKNGEEVRSFTTEDFSYLDTGSITVGNIIEREVYTYNRALSSGTRIVFSLDTDVLSKNVLTLDNLK